MTCCSVSPEKPYFMHHGDGHLHSFESRSGESQHNFSGRFFLILIIPTSTPSQSWAWAWAWALYGPSNSEVRTPAGKVCLISYSQSKAISSSQKLNLVSVSPEPSTLSPYPQIGAGYPDLRGSAESNLQSISTASWRLCLLGPWLSP